MGYASIIDNQLLLAFNMSKDLARFVTFVKKLDVSFNFGTSTVSETPSSITTKILDVKSEKTSRENNITKKTIMFKRKEVGDLTLYDTIIDGGLTWNLGSAAKDNGFIGIVDIYKEL